MLLRLFYYKLKEGLRNKAFLGWNLIFPFLLGTVFFAALGHLYDEELNEPMNIVIEKMDNTEELHKEWLKKTMPEDQLNSDYVKSMPTAYDMMNDTLSKIEYDDGTKMFNIKNVDKKEAEKLLTDDKIDAIINPYDYENIKMEIKKNGIKQSILTSIVTAFREGIDIKEYVKTSGLQGNNKDPYIQYFYNILAMISIMTSSGVMISVVKTQANYSAIGIRVESSPVNRVVQSLCSMLAMSFLQVVILILSIIYYVYILKVNFGCGIQYIFITSMFAAFMGCSLGYMVACVGNASENVKNAILIGFVTGGGFLAGLMKGDMYIVMEKKFPLVNRINPSSIITNAFYTLNMYGANEKYTRTIVTMFTYSIIFIAIGMIFRGRRGYASI
ncbi:ABC-type multidrug transport system, permease component [Eubacterium uniforme]|uniref:ABC-type multidrug transport system, permease component n=1 Tax=Eubacterium uniforme TaxID=39495 RepID=A0A1T4W0K8_9FIRM|nr:ABC transporter permease [Eubacterium uniforme]SKA70737.1 ABC-type multidrug transport system, permease component [Eubacterium uniforme]